MGNERVKDEDFVEREEERGREHSMKLFKKRFVPILTSTVSVTGCVTSGTNCQLQLYHLKAYIHSKAI